MKGGKIQYEVGTLQFLSSHIYMEISIGGGLELWDTFSIIFENTIFSYFLDHHLAIILTSF